MQNSTKGVALVVVLSMLVLVAGLVVALLSRSVQQRQISASSASNMQSEYLGDTAAQLILGDLLSEIRAGSNDDPLAASAEVSVRLPIGITENGETYAPSAAPQRVGDHGIPTVVKASRSGEPFFKQLPGYTSEGIPRASAINTTNDPDRSGRYVPLRRWGKPQLMTADELNTFTTPDWIYVDREGKNPISFTSAELAKYGNRDSGNSEYVVGRYAYVIYDVGGLLDINVAGNGLDAVQNERRGRLHQVALGGLKGISAPDGLLQWRSPLSGTNASQTGVGLFNPTRDFIDVPSGEQAFINRQDLINFASRTGGPITPDALPYLTTFSRDRIAPSFAPDSGRARLSDDPALPDSSKEFNPPLLSVRFESEATLARPEGSVTVQAGTPVMPRRFPLTKLALLSESSPDADAIRYYFGLQKSGGSWEYVAATEDGRIAKLWEVAQQGREPNFFEILQAVIYAGSLGRHAGEPPASNPKIQDFSHTIAYKADRLRNRQVLQIGANIIDQWDADDLPTHLRYPSAVAGEFIDVWGVENLPYINQISLVPSRPEYNRHLFKLWAVFDLWNPHQNASNPPQGISEFRIIPTGGAGSAKLAFWLNTGSPATSSKSSAFFEDDIKNGGGVYQSVTPTGILLPYDIKSINEEVDLTFPADEDFSEPKSVGVPDPASESEFAGLLLADYDLRKSPSLGSSAVIPEKAQRPAATQKTLNSLYDVYYPYATDNVFTDGPMGERQYPEDTVFTNLNPTYWVKEEVGGSPGAILVYARAAAKAYNWVRFYPKTSDPISFELQAKANGEWTTVQRVEGWYAQSDEIEGGKDTISSGTNTLLNPTHHEAPGASLANRFYDWNTSRSAMFRYDPRTTRFGLSSSDNQKLSAEKSLRVGSDLWDGGQTPATVDSGKWLLAYGQRKAGSDVSGNMLAGFEAWKKASVTDRIMAPYGLVANHPDKLDAEYPMRYADLDGVIRPADGYWGALPTVSGRPGDRPVILNRPFRSVGELGYAFRDLPWKTLDFSTAQSGDLGLLDAFSLEEPTKSAVVAGKINLNTRRPEVLKQLLQGSAKRLDGIGGGITGATLSALEAESLASAIVAESTLRPFQHKGELVPRVLAKAGPIPASDLRKVEREAAIRTLAELGTTRTWNFLIDVIVQAGRFSLSSKSAADFQIQAERRLWVHVAIDRMTGQVLEIQQEEVHE